MAAVLVQNFFCFENLVNAAISAIAVVGISCATDAWRGTVTHQLPGDGSPKGVREVYLDGSPVIKKSSRITYGSGLRR